MLKAVIFDFDGVITDSEILHFRTFNQITSKFGFEIDKKSYYKDFLGLSDNDVFTMLKKEKLLNDDAPSVEEMIKQKNQLFEQLAKEDGCIIEGVRDFLNMLKQNSIPLAICSGALLSEIMLILEDAKLADMFETIVSADQVKKGKPAPDGFLMALKRLNAKQYPEINANECVVIEDAHWGLRAAIAAGMHRVAVTNSYDYDQLAPLAEMTVKNLATIKIDDLQNLCC
ncbi:MAG TPA: HAD family phosphatase [Sedimentisphaerales bacterium]|nr:HAD family phosphatase [Sedimentisphaerales bacterium]